jgi:hypothetical protein
MSRKNVGFIAAMERAKGIEPSALAWEARVLPLYDARPPDLIVRKSYNALNYG